MRRILNFVVQALLFSFCAAAALTPSVLCIFVFCAIFIHPCKQTSMSEGNGGYNRWNKIWGGRRESAHNRQANRSTMQRQGWSNRSSYPQSVIQSHLRLERIRRWREVHMAHCRQEDSVEEVHALSNSIKTIQITWIQEKRKKKKKTKDCCCRSIHTQLLQSLLSETVNSKKKVRSRRKWVSYFRRALKGHHVSNQVNKATQENELEFLGRRFFLMSCRPKIDHPSSSPVNFEMPNILMCCTTKIVLYLELTFWQP